MEDGLNAMSYSGELDDDGIFGGVVISILPEHEGDEPALDTETAANFPTAHTNINKLRTCGGRNRWRVAKPGTLKRRTYERSVYVS